MVYTFIFLNSCHSGTKEHVINCHEISVVHINPSFLIDKKNITDWSIRNGYLSTSQKESALLMTFCEVLFFLSIKTKGIICTTLIY